MKMTIEKRSNFIPWLMFLALASFIAGLLYVISIAGLSPDSQSGGHLSWLGQVLMLIVGMTTVMAMGLLQLLMQKSVHHHLPSDLHRTRRSNVDSKNLTPAELIGVDSKLALAKLQVEVKLRMHQLSGQASVTDDPDLALKAREREGLVIALHEVLERCDAALREKGIDDIEAGRIVALGEWLLDKVKTTQSTAFA